MKILLVPSNPRHILTEEKNQTLLHWLSPEVPSGRVEYYEVAIKAWYRDHVQRQRITAVFGSTDCVFNIPICIDSDYKYTLQVRSVNVAQHYNEIDHQIFTTNDTTEAIAENYYTDNDDLKCVGTSFNEGLQLKMYDSYQAQEFVRYKSVWEKGPTYNCSSTKMSRITTIALIVVISSIGILIAFYVARNKYNKMSNISCALPPGLEPITYPIKHKSDISNSHFSKSSKESIFNNESRHLLSSCSRDTGYSYSHDAGSGFDSFIPSSFGQSSGYISSNHVNEYCKTLKSTKDIIDDPILSPMEYDYTVMDLSKTIPKCNKFYAPNTCLIGLNSDERKQSKEFNQLLVSQNSYVKPHNILNLRTMTELKPSPKKLTSHFLAKNTKEVNGSSGYIEPAVLQKVRCYRIYIVE